MNLYVIYIGGRMEKSFIELHDMRFVIAEKIEDTYEELKSQWWGIPESLHLDCWGALKSADGHNIDLRKEPSHDINHLYFVNLGGYNSQEFTEHHKNIFVIASNKKEAKGKALQQISDWESPHRDYLYEVETCLSINTISEKKGFYIHLEESKNPLSFDFICQYVPIGKI